MAVKIPTTTDLTQQNLANFESELSQKAPVTDRAFLRVLSFIMASSSTGLYKLIIERALQNLAITATLEDLKVIGNNYGVVYKTATAAVLDITIPATGGATVGSNNAFIGDSNGVRYIPDSQQSESGGSIDLTVTSQTLGVAGNLNVDDTMTIESQVAGVESVATVVAINSLGTDDEDVETYRERVLDEIRSVGGGGNAVDYRTWAEKTPGVKRAFPYAGRPAYAGVSLPGERVVYIESESTIDPDGIAPQSLLDSVREYIAVDQDTGLSQPPLGLPNESDADGGTLWVESITLTRIFIEVRNLNVDSDYESQLKSDLQTELTNYLRAITSYVDGVDVEVDRNDTISSITVGTIAQTVFVKYSAFAASVLFGTQLGVYLTTYTLGQGEKSKLEDINYVTV